MQIRIKTLTGHIILFDMKENDTGLTLKKFLEEKDGIDSDQIRLIFGGKMIPDNELLSNNNKIISGSTIHMILQMRGG
jgi:ubiquitin-like protein Nedd8